MHLSSGLKYHPDYSSLPGIHEGELDLTQVRAAYEQAFLLNPKDSNISLALGVLSFIQRNFTQAAEHFKQGIKENPTDHTLWNKYGAALANNMQVDKAIQAYHQALEIRPNYVRTMANIGLAYRNLIRYQESAPFFLNALILNPGATHIWNYIRSSFLQMNRMELVEKMNYKDPNAYRGDFPGLLPSPDALPKPSLDRLHENEIWNE